MLPADSSHRPANGHQPTGTSRLTPADGHQPIDTSQWTPCPQWTQASQVKHTGPPRSRFEDALTGMKRRLNVKGTIGIRGFLGLEDLGPPTGMDVGPLELRTWSGD